MTSVTRRHRAAAASLAVGVLLGVTACTGDDGGSQSTGAPPVPTPTSASSAVAPAPSTPVTHAPAVNPLNGGKPSKNGVVAVKIDDTGNGRPQRNINQADVVYIEQVEGGLTRLLAVYNSRLPVVAYVRSTRPADPELLAQYGPIGFVASGGAHVPLQILRKSPLKTSIGDFGGPGITRDHSRRAPYNEVANLKTAEKALKPPKARKVGFRWSPSTAALKGTPVAKRIRTVVGGTGVEFRYKAKTHRYVRYINGTAQRTASGNLITTRNVIVQFCKVKPFNRDRDVLGNPNAFTYTVGKGKIAVFRDGHRVNGAWSRAKAKKPTTFRSAAGKPIPLRPGGVWVVLTKKGNRIR